MNDVQDASRVLGTGAMCVRLSGANIEGVWLGPGAGSAAASLVRIRYPGTAYREETLGSGAVRRGILSRHGDPIGTLEDFASVTGRGYLARLSVASVVRLTVEFTAGDVTIDEPHGTALGKTRRLDSVVQAPARVRAGRAASRGPSRGPSCGPSRSPSCGSRSAG